MKLKSMLEIVHMYTVEIFTSSACVIKFKNAFRLHAICISYVMLLQQDFYS